jgi:preprotein translocase subunit YajC
MQTLLLQNSTFLEQMQQTLAEQSGVFIATIPRVIGAIALVIIGRWISKFFARVTKKLLEKVGVDRLAAKLNEIDLFSKSNIEVVPSKVVSKIVYYLLFFIVILIATDVLRMQAVSDMMNNVLAYIPSLISAVLVFFVGILLADFLKRIVQTTCESLGIPAASLIANVVFYFLFLNVAMITLSQARVQTSFIEENLSIILGGVVLAFAIGYGFASRPVLANLLAAYYNKGKVAIGDVIVIEGVEGQVVAMDNSTFTIKTGEALTIVPLHKLSTEKYQITKKQAPQEQEEAS